MLHPVPHSAGLARMFVRHHLLSLRREQYVEAAESVVTELVTNATRESRAPVWVRLDADGDSPLIEVWDCSVKAPELQWPGELEERGRGLLITNALSARCGYKRLPSGGKVVFSVLRDPNPDLP